VLFLRGGGDFFDVCLRKYQLFKLIFYFFAENLSFFNSLFFVFFSAVEKKQDKYAIILKYIFKISPQEERGSKAMKYLGI